MLLILSLFVILSCKKDEVTENGSGSDTNEYNLSLSGTIINSNLEDLDASSFKLQLIKGEVSVVSFDNDSTFPDAQVFVTEKGNNSFEFNNLQEGEYTLITTKSGYEISENLIEIKKNIENTISIEMEKGNSSGISGKIQILDENGNDLSTISINPNSTISVFFYLYNGTASDKSYNIYYSHNEGYLGKSFIINGQIEHLYSDWITDINPSTGIIEPNGIHLIEVSIDPIVYLLREHSECNVIINNELEIELAY